MEAAAGTLTFWGVRGSIPAPGLHTITFGGNTSCVSVEYREHVIIFDAGSGLRQLGLYLLARHGQAARKMGIPFGPFLALGSVVALFAGQPLLHAYWHLWQ